MGFHYRSRSSQTYSRPRTMYQPRFLFSFPLVFIFFVKSDGNPIFTNCPSFQCGTVTIRYPFWQMDNMSSQQYCGYPGLGLNCSTADNLIFHIPDDTFYVRNINYDNNTVSLVDIDTANANLDCPRPRHNYTLPPTLPLAYSALDTNLSFFFNCTFVIPFANPIECLRSDEKESYVFLSDNEPEDYDLGEYCQEKVVATVVRRGIDSNPLSSWYVGALREGFVLDWRVATECRTCEESHGRCGYDNVTGNFVCFCSNEDIKTDRCKGRNSKVRLAIGVSLSGMVILFGTIIFCYWRFKITSHKSVLFWTKKTKCDQNLEDFFRHVALKRYSYSDIKKMTNSFKEKLGQGGYGVVYKGSLLNGHIVAAKVLNESKGNGEDFINEVASISRTSHVNVVTLIGFCLEGRKRALIYDFMPNGSLEKFIYGKNPTKTGEQLGWENLYQIAIGIARGLEYLHRGCNTRILHLDIKPHNILLDGDFCPKISDFGLSKLCSRKESIVSMFEARGTIGYIAPEVFSRNYGGVSNKSDVYSYGMMILEMVGGRKNVDVGVSHTSKVYFPHWAYKRLELDEDLELQDVVAHEESEIARKMILVGFWCIQADPSQRPSMNKVIDMLEGSVESLKIPPKPFLYSPSRSASNSFTTAADH